MTLTKFIASTILVSAAFSILVVPLLLAGSTEEVFQNYPLILFFPLPYFLGALLNKEGYWARSLSVPELLKPLDKKEEREYSWTVRIFTAVLVALAISLPSPPKDIFLLLLGVSWGFIVTRAWFIYQQCLTSRSRPTR